MPKVPPCSQYEPPVHILVTRKTGTKFCRKKAESKGEAPNAFVKKVRKTRSNKGVKRGPKANGRGGLGAMVKKHPMNNPKKPKTKAKAKANDPNKGKFLVTLKFRFNNTRNGMNLNNKNWEGRPLFTEANKNIIRNTKAPTNKEFSNYMGNSNRYKSYLENLYGYANYGRVPPVRNYKNSTVKYVLDPNVVNFNGKPMFPTAQSIKNNLRRHKSALANGTWAAPPGSHGVYPVKLSNGTLSELGVISYNNNVNVKKL